MKTFICCVLLSALPCFATVTVAAPSTGTSMTSPVHFVAAATTSCANGISSVGIYTAPYVLAYKVAGASLNTSLTLAPGTYNTVIQAWDKCGGSTKTASTVTVKGTSTSA